MAVKSPGAHHNAYFNGDYNLLLNKQVHHTHGIMGTPMPNKFSYLQPRPAGKYTTYDHARRQIHYLRPRPDG